MSRFIYYHAECHYAEYHYAECHCVECRYAECCGIVLNWSNFLVSQTHFILENILRGCPGPNVIKLVLFVIYGFS